LSTNRSIQKKKNIYIETYSPCDFRLKKIKMLVVVILTEYLVSANRRRQQKTEKKGCKHFQN